MATDLHTLLDRAQILGPYVLPATRSAACTCSPSPPATWARSPARRMRHPRQVRSMLDELGESATAMTQANALTISPASAWQWSPPEAAATPPGCPPRTTSPRCPPTPSTVSFPVRPTPRCWKPRTMPACPAARYAMWSHRYVPTNHCRRRETVECRASTPENAERNLRSAGRQVGAASRRTIMTLSEQARGFGTAADRHAPDYGASLDTGRTTTAVGSTCDASPH